MHVASGCRGITLHALNITIGLVCLGDCEIAVEWFHRDISGGDERRTFKAWKADEEAGDAGPVAGQEYTFNSTELRLISSSGSTAGTAIALEMRLLPPVGGTPLSVCSRRARGPLLAPQISHARTIAMWSTM